MWRTAFPAIPSKRRLLTQLDIWMPRQSPQTPHIRYQHWIFKLPFVRRYRGMVIARTILFKNAKTEITPALLRHELAHVEQIDRYGIARFYLIYFYDYLANLCRLRDHDAAYRHIRFEREARELERLERICER